MKINQLTINKVQFSIDVLEEDQPVSEALSFKNTGADHSEYIQKVEEDNGYNPWLWCTVKVIARFGSLEGTAYLGACAYESVEDFKKGGYYEQMQQEAFEDLKKEFDSITNALRVPTIKERVLSWLRSLRRRISPKALRTAALCFMWLQMLSVIAYRVVQHPVINQFINR